MNLEIEEIDIDYEDITNATDVPKLLEKKDILEHLEEGTPLLNLIQLIIIKTILQI